MSDERECHLFLHPTEVITDRDRKRQRRPGLAKPDRLQRRKIGGQHNHDIDLDASRQRRADHECLGQSARLDGAEPVEPQRLIPGGDKAGPDRGQQECELSVVPVEGGREVLARLPVDGDGKPTQYACVGVY